MKINGMQGRKHSEETKKKLSESRASRKWSDAEREAYKKNVEKRTQEKESQRKLCACGCGELAKYGNKYIVTHHHRNRSEETRKRFSEARKGKKIKEETKIKISETISKNHPRGMKGKGTQNWLRIKCL